MKVIEEIKCNGEYKDFIWYGYGTSKKSVCTICGNEHKHRMSFKNKTLIVLGIMGFPAFVGAMITGTKIFYCTWFSDASCWSHFP